MDMKWWGCPAKSPPQNRMMVEKSGFVMWKYKKSEFCGGNGEPMVEFVFISPPHKNPYKSKVCLIYGGLVWLKSLKFPIKLSGGTRY